MNFRNSMTREAFKRGLLWMIVVGGVLAMLWPISQVVYGWWNQRALRQEWAATIQKEHAKPNSPEKAPKARGAASSPVALTSQKGSGTASRAKQRQHPTQAPRWLPTRLVILVRGVDTNALKRGPGHDSTSALPGQKGNCVIAAHRNAYGWWFYRLNRLGDGALIELRTSRETLQYKVASTYVLPDTATWTLQAPPAADAAPRLTLYTCSLPHGPNRIVVTANLVRRAPA
jgi:sortase A